MAGKSARAIAVVDMSTVWGGDGTATSEMASTITAAIDAVADVSRKVAPRSTAISDVLLQVMTQRRSGPGPTSAPALPPTSTLTR